MKNYYHHYTIHYTQRLIYQFIHFPPVSLEGSSFIITTADDFAGLKG